MLRKLGAVIGLAAMMSGCQSSPTFLDPASPISTQESRLYWTILIMALVVFVLVEGALIWILIRDRKRPDDDQPPRQIFGNMRVEVTWTVIPILLVLSLFIMTVNTTRGVAAPAAQDSDLNLRIVGHRWWWEFDYLDRNFATANELHIPVGKTVQISLKSVDVIHSFWVPQLSGKTDVVPGQNNTMWLKADQQGVFHGQCAEFCGTQHALMRFQVFVDSQEDFDAWVANQQQQAYQPQTEAEQAGYKELTGACAACHSIDPHDVSNEKIGPNLTHLFSRTTFAGGTYDLTEANVRSWLKDTQAMKPGNDMEVTLSQQFIDNIVAYLMHLK